MIEWITLNQEKLLQIVAYVIATCAAISAVTPTRWDNEILDKISGFVTLLGLNVGKASNADGSK